MYIHGKLKRIGDDLSDIYSIRSHVFIDELKSSTDELLSEDDNYAVFVVVYDNIKGKQVEINEAQERAVAVGRLTCTNGDFEISQIAVEKEERGQKFGDMAVRMLVSHAFSLGAIEILAKSEISIVPFFEKIGFVKEHFQQNKKSEKIISLILKSEQLCRKCQKKEL